MPFCTLHILQGQDSIASTQVFNIVLDVAHYTNQPLIVTPEATSPPVILCPGHIGTS